MKKYLSSLTMCLLIVLVLSSCATKTKIIEKEFVPTEDCYQEDLTDGLKIRIEKAINGKQTQVTAEDIEGGGKIRFLLNTNDNKYKTYSLFNMRKHNQTKMLGKKTPVCIINLGDGKILVSQETETFAEEESITYKDEQLCDFMDALAKEAYKNKKEPQKNTLKPFTKDILDMVQDHITEWQNRWKKKKPELKPESEL